MRNTVDNTNRYSSGDVIARQLGSLSNRRMSDIEPRFVCAAATSVGQTFRPDFNWNDSRGKDGPGPWGSGVMQAGAVEDAWR
jgi:hypothetical protein